MTAISINLHLALNGTDLQPQLELIQPDVVVQSNMLESAAPPLLASAAADELTFSANPGDYCCFIYDEQNFSGDSKEFCTTSHTKSNFVDLDAWNDKMESFSCGKNVKVTWCDQHWTDKCDSWNDTYISSNAGRMLVNYNGYHLHNRVSSMKLEPYNYFTEGAITLFDKDECRGFSAAFEWDQKNQETASYNEEDLWDRGIGGDHAVSIMVPEGYHVRLYKNDGFHDYSETIWGKFSDDNQEMECQILKDPDQIKSLRVYRLEHAIAQWVQLDSSTESIDHEYTLGNTRYDDETFTSGDESSFTFEMETGIEFEALSVSAKMNKSSSSFSQTKVESYYGQTAQDKFHKTCTLPEDGSLSGAVLWGYQVQSNQAHLISSLPYTICKFGETRNIAPACPAGFCLDAECTECLYDWED